MKSLQEVLEGIEAFKKDMEDLGAEVKVTVSGSPELLAIIKLELKEDLEEG